LCLKPRVRDPKGGYYQGFYANGTAFAQTFKQLVSSARMVINFMRASVLMARPELLALGRHGLDYVENVHYRRESRQYAFTIIDGKPADMTQQAYGYAFLLGMHAASRAAGASRDDSALTQLFDQLERRFYLGDAEGAYLDTLSEGGVADTYRGQNSNMHLCEMLIAAFEATHNRTYLARAELLADTFTRKLAARAGGFVWEHYTETWEVDWKYNMDDPSNIYRPWGFQPGHQFEWAKNLLHLHKHKPAAWKLERARQLFDGAWEVAWDTKYGGLIYGFAPNRTWCDSGKYFWVQAEAFATAALLHQATADARYAKMYETLWNYVWKHWVDHRFGAWHAFNMTRDNRLLSDKKAIAGAKCDYHSMQACVTALEAVPA